MFVREEAIFSSEEKIGIFHFLHVLMTPIKDGVISHGRAREIIEIKKLELISLHDKLGSPIHIGCVRL